MFFLIILSSVLNRLFFQFLAFLENCFLASEVYIIRGDIAQCLMIPLAVIPGNKFRNFFFQLTGMLPDLQLNFFFKAAMITFYLAIGLGMIRRSQDVANPFFAGVAKGVEQIAYAEGYNVFLGNTSEDPERELAMVHSLEEKRVDGLILCSSRLRDGDLRQALRWHSAVVLVNRRLGGYGSVLIDDHAGATALVEHLLGGGRERIGLLAGPSHSHSSQQRVQGYRSALQNAGREQDDAWVQHCAPAVEGGLNAATALLTAHPRLDALLCYNDLVAVGALQAAASLGRVVPDDLAITGFDDIPISALVSPALTTCHVPVQDIGAEAMRLLLDKITGCARGCEEVILEPALVIRASSGSGAT